MFNEKQIFKKDNILKISSFLDEKSLLMFNSTCKRIKSVMDNNALIANHLDTIRAKNRLKAEKINYNQQVLKLEGKLKSVPYYIRGSFIGSISLVFMTVGFEIFLLFNDQLLIIPSANVPFLRGANNITNLLTCLGGVFPVLWDDSRKRDIRSEIGRKKIKIKDLNHQIESLEEDLITNTFNFR